MFHQYITKEKILRLSKKYYEPFYIISKNNIKDTVTHIKNQLSVSPYGYTLRYAMKANPHREVLKIMKQQKVDIDASSYYEVCDALASGIPATHISMTSQELPPNEKLFKNMLDQGVWFNATSIHQLKSFCALQKGKKVGIRINPGFGSGYNKKLETGGITAGFGIWYEYLSEAKDIAQRNNVTIQKIHTHIGSGAKPQDWIESVKTTLSFVEQFPTVTHINIGGGFKTKYTKTDAETNMGKIVQMIKKELILFYKKSGRKIHIEIEPGRLLVVHSGVLVSKVIDITDTGKFGFTFLKLNTGMTEILRPSLYGAQHELTLIQVKQAKENNMYKKYVVIGHCCESGDCLSVSKGDPETIEPVLLKKASIGDILVVKETGAYCYKMSAVGYNSFPEARVFFI